MLHYLHLFVDWIVSTVGSLGYPGIIAMMTLESSFFPFPSEVAMIPGGYLASKGEMDLTLVILAGLLGSLIGAVINYAIAVYAGRAALLKWGHLIFLPEHRFLKIEKYFVDHGEIGTFIGRFIPVVRQFISFPAGLVRMSLPKFLLFTGLGAGLWGAILAYIGYHVGENEELVAQWTQTAIFWVLLGCAGLIVVYWKVRKSQ